MRTANSMSFGVCCLLALTLVSCGTANEGAYAPNCSGTACAADSGADDCGSCGPGQICSAGVCTLATAECTGAVLSVSGLFNNSQSPVQFDAVTAEVRHKIDVDEYEDGCITDVTLVFSKGTGCKLTVSAGGRHTPSGLLAINEVSFTADSQCPGFPDTEEGSYVDSGLLKEAGLQLAVSEVPGYNMPVVCFDTTVSVALEGALVSSDGGKTLQVSTSGLTVSGEFLSTGDPARSCPCEGSCVGKECGDDGCGGECGICSTGKSCVAGSCTVKCGDGVCFSDGGESPCTCPADCGGCAGCCVNGACKTGNLDIECGKGGEVCYPCEAGESCKNGACTCTCGDGVCVPNCWETCQSCPADCGVCCGNGTCDSGETQCSCPKDCGDPCAGKECGADGCGGNCGVCPGGSDCKNGACQCTPACAGKQCGDDGCGGSCGTCPAGKYCVVGLCQASCGNGKCDFEETKCTCPADCGDPCVGKECGEDGYACGKNCGVCPAGEDCHTGLCVNSCGNGSCDPAETKCLCPADCGVPCLGKQCGNDGCGGSCGTCPPGKSCNANGLCK